MTAAIGKADDSGGNPYSMENKMKKKVSYAYVASFLILLVMPTVLFTLFGEFIDQVNYEQRNAAQKPVFSLSSLNAYPSAYETYYNDNLPFRTQLIEANSLIDFYLFRESPSDMVVLGKDGWLFYNPGGIHYNPIADYCGTSELTKEQMAQIASQLITARDTLEDKGKEFVLMITPNKECIYGTNYMSDDYPVVRQTTRSDMLVEYLRSKTDLRIVYPKEELIKKIQENGDKNFYFKSDTHWNHLGAYVGARQLLLELGITLPAMEELEITENNGYSGDLVNMMGLSKYIKSDWDYTLSGYSEGVEINKEYLKEMEDPEKFVRYSTVGKDERRICVLRDSYTTSMTPYITSQFNECYLLHRGIYTPELLAETNADIVVLQVVEREIESLLTFTVETD